MTRSRSAGLLVALGLSCVATRAGAQAWLGAKGETTVSLTYQENNFQGHLDEKGKRDPHGSAQSQAMDLGIDYGVSDRLALSFSVPYVAIRNGPDPSPVSGLKGNDDGHYHSTWQDYHAELRYNLLNAAFVVTPFVGAVIPTHHYAVLAEAGQGRDLHEAQIGINVGRLLSPQGHQPFLDARFLYAVPERVRGISTNRLVADGALGLFVTPGLSIRGLVNWQWTYGGLTADQVFVFGPGGPPTQNPNLDDELYRQHDRILQDRHLRAGVAASWALTGTTDLYGGFMSTVSGRGSHYGNAFSVGFARTLKR